MNLVPLEIYSKTSNANPKKYDIILVDSDQDVFSCSPAEKAAYDLNRALSKELFQKIMTRLWQYDKGGGVNDFKGGKLNGKTIFHQSETVDDGSLSFFFRLYGLNLANHQLEDITEVQKDNNGDYKLKVKIGNDTVNYCDVEELSLIFTDHSKKNTYKLRMELLGIGEHNNDEKSNKKYVFWVYNKLYFKDGNFSFGSITTDG